MLDRRTDAYPTWDDTPHALKIMSKVVVRSGARVNGLSIVYTDGSVSNSYGSKCTEHVFELSPGEYISDVIVWENEADVSTVQFITTTGRFSPLYGGYRGVPRILNSAGGVLAGFSGRMTDPYKDRDTVGRVQAIWRHDIPHSSTPSENRQTTYIGGPGGQPFNDWPFNGSPHSAYIKGVNVWCRDEIGSIQVTYSQQCSGGTVELNAGPYCSKPRGEKRSFELDAEEHIIAVSGTQTDRVLRLCFFTNKGRTSPTFGKNDGEAFMHQPKTIDGKSMRLAFIMGKQ
ncbi:hypothetical protein FRC09_014394 [Ceratobasidium sp. 395]|nr:hypothetical protein FRC09_014394 [Ceratobasidium sp. 395]